MGYATTARVARRAWLLCVAVGLGSCTSDDRALEARAPAREAEMRESTSKRITLLPSPPPTVVTLSLHHYAIEPAVITVPAGPVTLSAINSDGVPHDVVLLRSPAPADRLPTVGIRVDESAAGLEVLGRTDRLGPAESGSFTAAVEPGTYVLVCTVPHHYVREAMVATLTASPRDA